MILGVCIPSNFFHRPLICDYCNRPINPLEDDVAAVVKIYPDDSFYIKYYICWRCFLENYPDTPVIDFIDLGFKNPKLYDYIIQYECNYD